MRLLLRLGLCLVVLVGVVGVHAPHSSAAACPSARSGGRPVGWIDVGQGHVPLTLITPTSRGALDPPPTNKAVGLSTAHAPLDSSEGTSVLAWHVRYGPGCPGAINTLATMPLGSTFTIGLTGGDPMTFRIFKRLVVPRGQYRHAWFRTFGPHQVAAFTCTDLRGGAFRKTLAVFATPVG